MKNDALKLIGPSPAVLNASCPCQIGSSPRAVWQTSVSCDPSTGEMPMIPSFPYKQASVQVQGSAYYYDLGKFLADFENHFPYMRLQNLVLEPGGGGEDREKLSFHMDIITLVKP